MSRAKAELAGNCWSDLVQQAIIWTIQASGARLVYRPGPEDNTGSLNYSLEPHTVKRIPLSSFIPPFVGSIAIATSVALGSASMLHAQEEKKAETKVQGAAESSEIKTEAGRLVVRVTDGLNNPTCVAVQPETGLIFVADSGNGQVVRVLDGKIEPVITDFPKESLGTNPPVNIGPLSLAFLNRDNLLVGTGGQPAGEDSIRQYALTPAAMKFDASKNSLTLIADPIITEPAEGNFFGLAVAPNAIYASSHGSAAKGWVSLVSRSSSDSLTNLARHLASTEAVGVATPTSVTLSPHGYLIVSNIGELGEKRDSVAAFYEPVSKKMLMKMELGLCDVCSIAYSPRRQMYALDMAWGQPHGGLYRVIEDKSAPSGLKTKLIVKLPNPTSMCFDSDGAVFVTLRGTVDEKGNSKGALVRIPSEENL